VHPLPMPVADILQRIDHGTPADRFNSTTYEQSGDRTPTDAWRVPS
jgi:hypothetical protein